ncbi:MAG: insulinase family protein [Saprospiraceae bacterium]|nr:insulinase family protein [Saprospiraceae bacterium]
MKLRPYLILLNVLLFTMLNAQYSLVEKVVKKTDDQIIIPYEKYVFDNGLTVVVHEDHSDPIVHVDVTYHVGSAREEIGKSGFAHFFEHMMFQGSDNVADEQHFKIITEAGGTLNGSTNRDRTNYFETVPSNQLEKMLWLEADRMGFLLDAVTQQKFEIQRATVKNERGQNYDNRPYGLITEKVAQTLYPYGHPYSWLTIGYIEDLNRVDVNDLKNFFLRWYGPNNATLTIGGDVDTKEVLKMVQKYFGGIPMGPKVEKVKLDPVSLDKNRYVSMVDNYAKLPMLVCAMPSVPRYDKDEGALDCLAQIIGGDNNSILYQKLVKTQKALNVRVSNGTDELAGNFTFMVTPKPGTPLGEMEEALKMALKEFESKGASEEDVQKFKNNYEAMNIYGLESVSGKVRQLAAYQTFTGNPNFIQQELKNYTSITPADVMRVYNKYIKDKPMVVLSVLTKGNELMKVTEDNFTIDTTKYTPPSYGYDGLKYVKPKDSFDRSVMPSEGPAPVVKVPEYVQSKKGNYDIIEATSDEIPVVVISLELKGGQLAEQNDLSKLGLSSMFARMMNEDTKNFTSEEMSAKLDLLGASINIGSDLDNTSITIRTLTKNLKPTLELLEERLLRPDFKAETFDRIKNQTIEGIKNSKSRAATVATDAYNKMLYGDESVFGLPSNGTEKTVANITLADVENYYKQYFSRNGMKAVVVGPINKEISQQINDVLQKLPDYKVSLEEQIKAAKTKQDKTIYVVDIPKAAQTEFRIGYVTDLKYDATGEFYKAQLMNYLFGGSFNGRININLREDKGWTYGARTSLAGNNYTGSLTFSSGILASATDSTVVEFFKELNNYAEKGISDEELTFLKQAISQSEARRYETGFQKAGFVSNILKYGLDKSYVTEQNNVLKNLTKQEVNKLASKYMDQTKMKIVLAGDKAKIQGPLEALGYTVVSIDSEGNVIDNQVKP